MPESGASHAAGSADLPDPGQGSIATTGAVLGTIALLIEVLFLIASSLGSATGGSLPA